MSGESVFPSSAPEQGETSGEGVQQGVAVEPTSIPSSATEGGESSGEVKDDSGSLDRLPEVPSSAAE